MTAFGGILVFRARPGDRPLSTQLSRSPSPPERSLKGHEDAFPRPRLSARCWFSQGTFAGTWGNGRDAPIPDLPTLTPEREVRPFPDGRLGAHEIGTPANPRTPGLSEAMLCDTRPIFGLQKFKKSPSPESGSKRSFLIAVVPATAATSPSV